MALRTKSIYEPVEEEDGLRVLITRFYPRGVKKDRFDEWVQVLSPSPELLFSYRDGKKDWEGFRMSFITELSDNVDSLEAIQALNEASKTENVTLLCYERSGNPCHRHLVRDIVETPSLISKAP